MTQVSGSAKTLLDAIQDGDVERPGLMRWNAWQQWRRGAGRSPVAARDGTTTTNAEESALWKSVMCDLYGTEWSIQLAAAEHEEAEVAPEAAPSAVAPPAGATSSQPLEPSLVPAEGAGSPLGPGPSIEESPGSGDARTGAAGPGSGRGNPVPSWSSQNPGTSKS